MSDRPTGPEAAPRRIVLWPKEGPDVIDEMTTEDWTYGDVCWSVPKYARKGVEYVRVDLVSPGLSPVEDSPSFTPGPWKIVEHDDPEEKAWKECFISSVDDCFIADVQHVSDGHLISATPDLYGALREAVESCDKPGGWLERARQALARAEGREEES